MKKIYLAFVWHQHQPIYKNPVNDTYELPWVRLHATKDYYDMVSILDGFPKIKSNINLVPSLLVQLEEYASGNAKDRFLDLTLKDAALLSDEDKVFILLNFFMANLDNMICPNNRYFQLFEQRGRHTSESEIKNSLAYFREQDFRDLQVLFNLVWFDPYWVRTDEFIASLFIKGRDFTEQEKHKLIEKQLEICGKIVQKHKQAQDAGQIEVSISPFYHPILPLLCDTNVAHQATPQMPLPQNFSHHEDAKWQIENAINYYQKVFGTKPKGMWPSEGSVSDEAVSLISQAGIKWIATDETVLFNSRQDLNGNRKMLFRPYNLSAALSSDGQANLNIIFRDHGLSDLIGFEYSRWNAVDAANDFISKLYDIRNYLGDDYEAPLVSVILDGENCWEYYKNDGWDFLSELYSKLSQCEDIETVRVSDYLERFGTSEKIEKLTAGSWIYGNFAIWIGNGEDNKSWNCLGAARDFLISYLEKNPNLKGSPQEQQAWSALRIAQGSDWNWWYGPENISDNDNVFDYLYRHYLMRVYQVFDQEIPEILYSPIQNKLKNQSVDTLNLPTSKITPYLDGEIGDDWNGAGQFKAGKSGGAMFQISSVIKSISFGVNERDLFIGLCLGQDVLPNIIKDMFFEIRLISPLKAKIVLEFNSECQVSKFILKKDSHQRDLDRNHVCYKRDIEMLLPFDVLSFDLQNKNFEFVVAVFKNGFEIEKFPKEAAIKFVNE